MTAGLRFDEIIQFDTARFPFDAMVLAAVRGALPGLRALDDLAKLHEFITEADFRVVEDAIYAVFASSDFQDHYDGLCAQIIRDRFGDRASYQRIPSVRVQLRGAKSVHFHTDEWYGHGHDVNNFWLPLVRVRGNGSMFVLGEDISERLVDEMKREKRSILEMDEMCRPHGRPLDMRFGEIYVFNSHMLHGSVVNDTDRSRVSFDFRMLPDGVDRGVKDPSFFVRPGARRHPASRGTSLATAGIYFSGSLKTDLVLSQKYQQLLCLRYASDHGLGALVLETELWGFDHHPTLWDMVSGSYSGQFENLIIFSTKLLPPDDADRGRLIAEAKRRGMTLHFVAEDIVSPPGQPLAIPAARLP